MSIHLMSSRPGKGFVSMAMAVLITQVAHGRSVDVPVHLDNAFLQEAVVSQVFTQPGPSTRIWDDGSGCNFMELSEPRVSTRDGLAQLITRTDTRIGQSLAGRCIAILDWSGVIETSQSVKPDASGTAVRFEVVDSRLHDQASAEGTGLGALWDAVKRHVHPRLSDVRVDLQPALEDLRSVMRLVLPASGAGLEGTLDSIALTSVTVVEDGIKVRLSMEVPDPPAQAEAGATAEALSPTELARFEAAWQGWDSFVTFVIKHFAAGDATAEVRRDLLTVLIEARYDLLDILAADPGRGRPDPVRNLFMNTWTRLGPVLRRMGSETPGERGLRLLSFVTAADALQALDALGPAYNLDVSLDGLRRMARILSPETTQDPLEYHDRVDPNLRELFDFGPPLPLRSPAPESAPQGWWQMLAPRVYAAVDDDLVERLNGWVPGNEETEAYLQSMHQLLSETGRDVAADSGLDQELRDMFRLLVLATAWQETCWRQFTRSEDKIVPIRSPAGAVGLMQVVPNVWRGFYDPQGLKTDVAYNAAAGGEILMHYLTDYALARGEDRQPGGRENLAWATYAAYNGGPRHLPRYRERGTPDKLKNIDVAFRDKYEQLRDGDELAVRNCYTG